MKSGMFETQLTRPLPLSRKRTLSSAGCIISCPDDPLPTRGFPESTARRAADIRNRAIHCLVPCDFVITTLGAGVSLAEPAANPLVYLTGAEQA